MDSAVRPGISYRCGFKECSKVFSGKSERNHHEKVDHGPFDGEVKLFCGLALDCERSFTRQNTRDRHEREDHGDKFECEACNRNFTTKRALKEHEKFFHGSDKFVCNICNKAFPRETRLQHHKHKWHSKAGFGFMTGPGKRKFIELTGSEKKNDPATGKGEEVFERPNEESEETNQSLTDSSKSDRKLMTITVSNPHALSSFPPFQHFWHPFPFLPQMIRQSRFLNKFTDENESSTPLEAFPPPFQLDLRPGVTEYQASKALMEETHVRSQTVAGCIQCWKEGAALKVAQMWVYWMYKGNVKQLPDSQAQQKLTRLIQDLMESLSMGSVFAGQALLTALMLEVDFQEPPSSAPLPDFINTVFWMVRSFAPGQPVREMLFFNSPMLQVRTCATDGILTTIEAPSLQEFIAVVTDKLQQYVAMGKSLKPFAGRSNSFAAVVGAPFVPLFSLSSAAAAASSAGAAVQKE